MLSIHGANHIRETTSFFASKGVSLSGIVRRRQISGGPARAGGASALASCVDSRPGRGRSRLRPLSYEGQTHVTGSCAPSGSLLAMS
jgi:hypothetical protein